MTSSAKRWLSLILILSLFTLMGTSQIVLQFKNYTPPDSYDYVQLARNITETGTFRTQVITPLSWSRTPSLTDHPDLWRAPVYPLLVAAGFTLFGPNKLVPLGVSLILFLSFLVVFHRVVERLFSIRTAMISGLLVLSHVQLARAGVSALSESTYLFFLFLGLLIVLRSDDHPLLFGLVSGLAYLTRYNHWFLLIGLLFVALRRSSRRNVRYLFLATTSFLALLSPWMIRNLYHAGLPFYHHHTYLLASHTPSYPQFDVFFQFDSINPLWFALTHPAAMFNKAFHNLLKLYRWVPRYFGMAWPVAILAVWHVSRKKIRTRPVLVTLLMGFGLGFVLQAVGLSFVHMKSRHYIPFLPVIFLLAGHELSDLYQRRRLVSIVLVSGLVGLNLFTWSQLDPWPAELSPSDYREVKKYVPKDEPIFTNAPELIAWYAERTSLWSVPYRKALQHYPPFRYVLLTPEVNRSYTPRVSLRQSFLDNEAFQQDFELVRRFEKSNSHLYKRVN